MTEKLKDESGVAMIEATYCIFVCLIVVMFFLSFGFFLYQSNTMSIIANEIAEETATTYKYRDADDSSDISLDDIKGVGKFRYMFFSGSFHTASNSRAQGIIDVRLTKSNLAKINGVPIAKVKVVADDIGRNHYEITIKQKYDFLFSDMLNWVGIDGKKEIVKTSYAEGVDVLSYVNTIRNTKYATDYVADMSGIAGLVDSVINFIHGILD